MHYNSKNFKPNKLANLFRETQLPNSIVMAPHCKNPALSTVPSNLFDLGTPAPSDAGPLEAFPLDAFPLDAPVPDTPPPEVPTPETLAKARYIWENIQRITMLSNKFVLSGPSQLPGAR